MGDEFEGLEELSRPEKIVKHFTEEKQAKTEKTIEQKLAYAWEMKQQKEEAEKEYNATMDQIKEELKVAGQKDKKSIYSRGDYDLIVTKKKGSVSIDFEKYITDTVGAEALKELEKSKDLAKEGKLDHKYISVGKETQACELVKRSENLYGL